MQTRGLQKLWRWSDDAPAPSALADLARRLGVHPLTAQILLRRGIVDPDRAKAFLEPKLADLHDPLLMPGLEPAAQRIVQAIRQKQPIVIYGDYDVDGVTASSILWHTLTTAGATVHTYVPHRIDEGYGLNNTAILKIAQGRWPINGDAEGDESEETTTPAKQELLPPPLIISVDCGITAMEPAKVAKDAGVDLIITDHHEPSPDRLPDAYALVHPRLPGSQYPFGDLCGAGVAFKLAWQVAKLHCGSERLPAEFRRLLVDLLSLAALGTVADVVPLHGENRIIATYGLTQIKHTQFVGLNALIDASKLRDEKIDAYHVGFVLGPRLNACGRMGHARRAVHLLTAAQEPEATEIAEFLSKENDRRRATERAIFQEATEMVCACSYNAEDCRAIVLGKEGWHPGVVGIVASRLVEAYSRPVVMMSFENGQAHGSARSVDGVSMHEALHHCAAYLDSFGGHAMAGGLRMQVARLQEFRQAMVQFVNSRLTPDRLVGLLDIDADCSLDDLNLDVFEQFQWLAPFGRGNPSPLLRLHDARLDQGAQRMGKQGQHLRLWLRQGQRVACAVAFGMGDLAPRLPAGARVDVVFEPKLSTWQGIKRPELHIKDLQIL